MELALDEWVQVRPPKGMRAGGLTLSLANGSIEWSRAEKLVLVAQLRESWQADELSYHSGLDPGL